MGRRRKKGGGEQCNTAEDGGDSSGDPRTKQLTQQPSSQVGEVEEAASQKNIEGKPQSQEKPAKIDEGKRQLGDLPQKRYFQGSPGFQQQSPPVIAQVQASGLGQLSGNPQQQQQSYGFQLHRGTPQQKLHSQRYFGFQQDRGHPQQQQYPQQPSDSQQYRESLQQYWKPPQQQQTLVHDFRQHWEPTQHQQHPQEPSGCQQQWRPSQKKQYPSQFSGFQQHMVGSPQQQHFLQQNSIFQQTIGPPQQMYQQPFSFEQSKIHTQQGLYTQKQQELVPLQQHDRDYTHKGPSQQQFAQSDEKSSGCQTQKLLQKQQFGNIVTSQNTDDDNFSKEGTKLGESQLCQELVRTADRTIEKFRPRGIVNLQDRMTQASLSDQKIFTPGTNGRRIKIETNYLNLDLGNLTIAYHYDVDINPATPKKFMRDVMEEFRNKHFPRYHPAFDGRKNLYSPFVLVEEGDELTDDIKIVDAVNGKEKNFKVRVQFATTVDLTPLRNIRMERLSLQKAIQCVEIVLRSAPSSRCIPAGSSFFTRPAQIIDLGDGMEMYQGFYQSVVRGWKPLLNVDVAHKAFPKEIDLVALTIELCSNYHQQLTDTELKTRGMSDDQKRTLEKFLRTLRVVYEIRGQPGSKREYRVNGIRDCPKRQTFRPDNGPEMTIAEYFACKKNYRLQYPLMPTIWVGNAQRQDPILLPAELCTLVPGQAVNRKMTENQTSAMIRRAATSTDVRKDKIMNSLQQTRHNEDLCIREFGFSVGRGFEQIQARVLEPPSLEYSNNMQIQPSRGVWRADNAHFLRGAQIRSWTIISACGPMENMARLADMIYSFGPKCGMSLMSKAEPPFDAIRGRPPRFGDIMASLEKCSKKQYDLVFVIIPDSGPTYSDVKRAAELNIGCLTQCIKRTTLFKKLNPATVNNILLKVNSKLNGTNHCLRVRPPVLDVPCMIMGADVTHPSPDSQNIPSVAAVTASHDPKAFCYNICCRLQSPKTEIITDLQAITREQLLYFHKMNKGQKPQRIIFFRDGVSEGQFKDVLAQEVQAIRNACTSLEEDYKPKLTFLVVQKRHHTRFFPKHKGDSEDRNNNVPAGTCVDTDITDPKFQHFYLVSHASIQGVAKPTKYVTLWDENDMSNDEIEALTYHLCHLFTRCNRSVSYPAPTYYAHYAAARAKVYIEGSDVNLNSLDGEQSKINILDIIRKQKPMFFV